MNVNEIRELVCKSGLRLMNEGLIAGTWGNISNRIDADTMVITPSGISYDELTPDDMVIANIHDLSYEGQRKPSSELNMHASIYKEKSEINAVIHNHSLYGSIVAARDKEVPPYIEDMAQVIGPSIRVVKHAITGTPELSEGVLKALDNRYGAIMQNHGAVCIGRDMKEAFAACHILEKSCQIFVYLELMGGGICLPEKYAEGFRDYYLNNYQKK